MRKRYDPRKLPVMVDGRVEPGFVNLPSRTRYWRPMFWGCVVIASVYLILNRQRTAEQVEGRAGWVDLVPCSYTASFDGTKNLGFFENGQVTLFDKSAKGGSID